MEQESSFSRMERTLWTVWCFITETVNRILRPQPTDTASTDPTPLPDSRPDGEPPDTQESTVDSSGGGIDEEQPHSSVTLLSSSASVVAWNSCTKGLKSDEEQLGRGNEDCQDTREEDCNQTGNDHTGMEKRDEETGGELVKKATLDDREKVDETTVEIQVMKDDGGEDSKEDGGEEELHTRTEEEEMQEEAAATALMIEEVKIGEGVLQLSSETKNYVPPSACDEDELIVATQEVRGESDQIKDEGVQVAAAEGEGIKEAAKQQTKEEKQDQEKNKRITEDDQKERNDLTQCSKDAVQETGRDTAEFTDKEEDTVDILTQTTTQTDVSEAENILDKSVVDTDEVEEERPSSEVHSEESSSGKVSTTASEPVKPEDETEPETSKEFKNIPQVVIEGQAPVLHEVNPKACEETREGVPEHNNELGSDENKTQSFLERGNYEEIHITQLPEEVESEEWASLKNSSTGDDYLLEERQDLVEKELTGNLHFAQVAVVNLEFEKEEAELLDTSMKTEIKPSNKEETGPADETNKDLCDEAEAVEFGKNRDETSKILRTEMTESSFCQELMKSTKPDRDETFSLPEETTDFGVLQQIESKLSDDGGTQLAEFDTEEIVSTDEEEEEKHEMIPTGAKLLMSQKDKETPLIVESGLPLHPETHVTINQSPLEAPQIDKIKMQTETEAAESNNLVTLEEEGEGETSSSVGEHQDVIDEEILNLWLEAATSKEESCTEEEPHVDTIKNYVEGKSGEIPSEEEEQLPSVEPASSDTETRVTINRSPPEAPQIDNIKMQTKTEAVESKTAESNNLGMSEEETEHFSQPEEEREGETSISVREHQGVIDEEILDLWLETATSKEEPRTEEEPHEDIIKNEVEEKSGEIPSEEEEHLPSVEPESLSDTEMPSSTLDSGFLDQSFSELPPLKPVHTGSLEDIHDMLASASKSIDSSDFSAPNSEFQAMLIEETDETVGSFLREEDSVSVTESRDSQEEKHLNEESETSEERSLEMKAGVTAGDMSLIDMKVQDEPLDETMSGPSEEIKLTESRQAVTETLLEEVMVLTEPLSRGEQSAESEESPLSMDAPDHSWPLPGLGRSVVAEKQTSEVDVPVLDFTVQKSRITAKNPRARRPSNPRSLIQKPSEDPTPSSHLPVKVPGVPLGGLGIKIKLPGFGGSIPVLKKTQKSIEVVDSHDTQSQEPEKKTEEGSEGAKPKWKPPGHPGFGIPLMSELKTKLKKTPKE